jgi:poly(3-hydroxybutyrate) depolymerase
LGLAPLGADARGYSARVLLRSAVLERTLNYWIYFPPGYNTSTQRYPVLYMLHGLGGSSNTWRAWGLFDTADQLIRAKQIAPLIIVAPQGDNGYWMNHADGGPRWEDYVVQELVPHVDGRYRTLATRAHRAVGGVSMGGNGAIRLMLDHPELFGAAGGHSPVFRAQTQAFAFFGTGLVYERNDPVSLVDVLGAPVAGDLWIVPRAAAAAGRAAPLERRAGGARAELLGAAHSGVSTLVRRRAAAGSAAAGDGRQLGAAHSQIGTAAAKGARGRSTCIQLSQAV